MTCELLLWTIARRHQEILGQNLFGLYVHGSIALGSFHWESSDVDLLTVVRTAPSLAQKAALIRTLLDLTPLAPPKGIEMSVVLLQDCLHFRHPVPYCLHVSPAHLPACRADLTAYCQRMTGTDPDLAAHFTVSRQAGLPLFAPPPQQVFAPIPRACYLDSVRRDIIAPERDIQRNPVYFTLNLCRTFAYLTTGTVYSKEAGGQWALKHLPARWYPFLQQCLTAYHTGRPLAPECGKQDIPVLFYQTMIKQIGSLSEQ